MAGPGQAPPTRSPGRPAGPEPAPGRRPNPRIPGRPRSPERSGQVRRKTAAIASVQCPGPRSGPHRRSCRKPPHPRQPPAPGRGHRPPVRPAAGRSSARGCPWPLPPRPGAAPRSPRPTPRTALPLAPPPMPPTAPHPPGPSATPPALPARPAPASPPAQRGRFSRLKQFSGSSVERVLHARWSAICAETPEPVD